LACPGTAVASSTVPASAINVGPVDPVLVYALGWVCLGGGWGLARGFAEVAKERQQRQRQLDELGEGGTAKLDLEVALGEVLVRTLGGVVGGFMIGALVGLLLALVALVFGLDVHDEAKTLGL
jgi:ABC-type nitrate/sulfonate/bicarbonate transport system permease component